MAHWLREKTTRFCVLSVIQFSYVKSYGLGLLLGGITAILCIGEYLLIVRY